MNKRVLLFLATNFLVVLTITVVLHLLGIDRYFRQFGIDNVGLLISCLFYGFIGAFISLALSRIMAKMAMGVEVIDPQNPGAYAGLVEMVHGLAQKAGLPAMPEVGVYESPELNAFATGPTRSRALVAVSTGLLRRMGSDEIEGVLGHEVTHIANGDMVTMTLLQGIVNAFVMFLARAIAFALTRRSRDDDDGPVFGGSSYLMVWLLEIALMPIGMIIVAWFSRRREYRADAGGASLAGRRKMADALRALQRSLAMETPEDPRGAALSTLKISKRPSGFLALLSTHPPLEDRIARLENMPG